MTAREELAAVLYRHREDALTCYDHAPTPERPVWCCVCGEHELTISWRDHVAANLARLLDEARREALTDAADEAEALRTFAHGNNSTSKAHVIGFGTARRTIVRQLRARADRLVSGACYASERRPVEEGPL